MTAKDATLLTMRIASLDLVLRSRRRRRLEGEVVTLLFQLYLSAYGVKPGNPAWFGNRLFGLSELAGTMLAAYGGSPGHDNR